MPHIDSYYASTKMQYAEYPSLNNDIDVDVCIVGGGLAGLTAARELLKHGKSVALLEGNKIGWGASGRNGGFVSDGYAEGVLNLEKQLGVDHTKALFDICREGTQYVRENIAGFAKAGQQSKQNWLNAVRHDVGEGLKKGR